jgi:hypothetical protein
LKNTLPLIKDMLTAMHRSFTLAIKADGPGVLHALMAN